MPSDTDIIEGVRPLRLSVAVIALTALVAACSSAEPLGTTTTLGATSTTPGATNTTVVSSTTSTSSAPTTGPPSEVTVDPYLPAAQPRTAIPWDEVGAGWHVLTYDPSEAYPTGGTDDRYGPTVLYLADPEGGLYEVASWEPDTFPVLVDATPTAALVMTRTATSEVDTYFRIELESGESTQVRTVDFNESSVLEYGMLASLTRPTGDNLVMHRAEAGREWLERQAPDGSVLSVVYERTRVDDQTDLSWLYGWDGTFLVVGDNDTLQMVAIDGTPIGEMWVPPDTQCQPVRWWEADTALVRCHQTDPVTALVDTDGNPHLHYDWLWLIPTDGSNGTELTSIPKEPTIVVDFGYRDAWPVDNGVLLQWTGDCGAAEVRTAEGSGNGLPIDWPEEMGPLSSSLLDVRDRTVALFAWEGCGGAVGVLASTDLKGDNLEILVPVVGDARGVTYVMPLSTVYPSP